MSGNAQRFDRTVAWRLIYTENKSQAEVARLFKVSRTTISKAMSKMKPVVTAEVGLGNEGPKVITTHLNTLGQLRKINENANALMEKYLSDKKTPMVAINAMKEIREQLKLQLDIMKTMYDVNSVAEFQSVVVDVIGKVNSCDACGEELVCKCGHKPDPRGNIIRRLKEAKALRQSATFR